MHTTAHLINVGSRRWCNASPSIHPSITSGGENRKKKATKHRGRKSEREKNGRKPCLPSPSFFSPRDTNSLFFPGNWSNFRRLRPAWGLIIPIFFAVYRNPPDRPFYIFGALKILCTTFLNYIQFADLWILKPGKDRTGSLLLLFIRSISIQLWPSSKLEKNPHRWCNHTWMEWGCSGKSNYISWKEHFWNHRQCQLFK